MYFGCSQKNTPNCYINLFQINNFIKIIDSVKKTNYKFDEI